MREHTIKAEEDFLLNWQKILLAGLLTIFILLKDIPRISYLGVLAAAIFYFFFVYFLLCVKTLKFYKIMFPLIFFIIFNFLSCFWGGTFYYSLLSATAIFAGFTVYLALYHHVVKIDFIVIILSLAGMINIFVDRNQMNLNTIQNSRLVGLFGNANGLAVFLSLAAFLLIYLPLKYKRIYRIIGVLFLIYSVSFTGSRKGLFLAVLVLLFPVFKWLFLNKSKNFWFRAWLIGAVIILFIFFYQFLVDGLFSMLGWIKVFKRTNVMLSGDNNIRYIMIEQGIVLWQQKPFFGWGAGQFKEFSIFGMYSHNNYVEILSNYGLIGFIFYYTFYFMNLKYFFRNLKSGNLFNLMGGYLFVMILLIEFGLVTLGQRNCWFFFMIASFFIQKTRESILGKIPVLTQKTKNS